MKTIPRPENQITFMNATSLGLKNTFTISKSGRE
jgi:hypothetical protein